MFSIFLGYLLKLCIIVYVWKLRHFLLFKFYQIYALLGMSYFSPEIKVVKICDI